MLTCFNLSAVRSYKTLFSGLGITVFPATVTCVLGPNGSGKTTLLRMLAGLLPPTQGEILLEDFPIREHPSYPLVVHYVGHKNALFDQMTVVENLTYWAKVRGDSAMVEAAIKHFALERYADSPCRTLSAGWQRRVALAKLLVTPSPIWILDEPFANLDEDGMYRLATAISTRANQKGAVILSSHNTGILKYNLSINISDYS